jgi:hypothetical protein
VPCGVFGFKVNRVVSILDFGFLSFVPLFLAMYVNCALTLLLEFLE